MFACVVPNGLNELGEFLLWLRVDATETSRNLVISNQLSHL